MRRAASSAARRPLRAAALLLASLAACAGDGSDVGPRLDHLPDTTNKVLVLDEQSRGVSAARVQVGNAIAVTGRSGRGDLLANPSGRRIVDVDVTAASANNTDRLASFRFAVEIPGQDLPHAIHVPDTSVSATATVATGTTLPATTLDDTAQSGARLLLAAGTVVADGGAPAVTLRLAALQREHLPGELPAAASGQQLWTRAIWVDPPTALFAPGATLDVPDDLSLPALAQAELWHLDATSGEWTLAGTAATASGGRLQLAGGVTAGGLYAYAIGIPAVATVRGRVLDRSDRFVTKSLVRVDSAKATTDDNGRFSVAVAATLADGSARTVNVELRGGGFWLPVGTTVVTPALASGADVDLGDVRLDTLPCGNVRLQCVNAGRADVLRRLQFSAVDGASVGAVLTDDRGQCTLEEIAVGFYGFLDGRLKDRIEIEVAEAIGSLAGGRRWEESRVFFDDRNWVVGSRSTRTQVLDLLGGGPLRDADVTRGFVAGSGFSGTTEDGGNVFVNREFDGRATATLKSSRDGVSITSAFSIEAPNGDHLELPLDRVRRAPNGAFDRHGTVAGLVSGLVGSSEQRLRAGRPVQLDEWFDEVLLGEPALNAVPTRLGGVVAASYRAGVALPRGHVALVEGTTAGPVFTPTGFAAALDLVVPEGTIVLRDLTLRRTFAAFTAPLGFLNLDPALAVADFRYALALRQPSGRLVDLVRDVGGGIAAAGNDAVLQLPTLDGEFAGGAWLAAMTARSADGKVRQQSLLEFTGPTGVTTPLLAVPVITAPLDGGTIAAGGFGIDYTLPAGALYATIELFSPGTDALGWTVVVPPERTHFDFVRLPTEADSPLIAGRTYTLTLTAHRVDTGDVLLQEVPYRELTTHWHAIGAGERGVRALSARSITVTAN